MNMVREAVRPIASKFEIPDVRVNGSFNAFAVILPLAFLYPLLRGCNYPRPFYRSLSKAFLALGPLASHGGQRRDIKLTFRLRNLKVATDVS